MGGILVIIFYCLFWYFCWIIARETVNNKSSKYFMFKRGVVFLFIASIPVNIQIVEYILFQQACSEAVVYFPEDKPPVPDILITNDQTIKNQGRYFDGLFKYIVSPHYSNSKPINLEDTTEQFNNYLVYPYKSEPLIEDIKKSVLSQVRYAYIYDSKINSTNWFSSRIEYYIYDFYLRKKISQVEIVSPVSRNKSLTGYFHVKISGCKNNTGFSIAGENIIKKTFVMEK